MQYTTHYNLNLPEGTDVVNPLVQDNPNYSAIDAAMFANKQAVIGSATEIVSGTVHAITRLNTDSDYFRFTATGNWISGDSMSVDGVNVSVYLSDGTTPATGAYIINTEVLALLSGSRVTLILSSGAVDASNVSYDNSGSGLIATNVQNAIDEIVSEITPSTVSVTASGSQTYSQVLDSLYALIDITKITKDTKLSILTGANIAYFDLMARTSGFIFANSGLGNPGGGYVPSIYKIMIKVSGSTYDGYTGSYSDVSSVNAPAGSIFSIEY